MKVAALLDSDPRAAARAAAQLLQEHPGHPGATLLLGTASRSLGDTGAAAATLAELAGGQPDSAVLQLELGRALAAHGEQQPALAALECAVRLQPDLAEAWGELSQLYAVRANEHACDSAYGQFLRLGHPARHLEEATRAISQRRFVAADAMLRARLAAAPADLEAMRLLAEVAANREDYAEAERLLGEVLRRAPGHGEARLDLARVLHSQQKAAPILPLTERLLAQDPKDLRYRTLQASAYNLLGQNERAMQIHIALIGEFPDNELLWLYYGHSLRVAGHLPEAIAAYRKSAQLQPQFGEAWFSLANLKTYRFSAEELAAMQTQAARTDLSEEHRLQFEFALAKALEDAGDYGASFSHYSRGNALRRAMVRYDPQINTRFVERSIALYTSEFFAQRVNAGSPAADPIFVLGLPRSGSTLIEQILASHSQVEGTRELPDVPGMALELGALELPGTPPTYPQSVARLSHDELRALGERYLEQTRPHRLLGRPYFIDKLPNNFCHVGLIHLMLPRARIIDVRRAAVACCFANFKQHFQSGAWFSYSLEELAQYYRDYVNLMAHFDRVLPGRVHLVRYENVVADLEGEVRRLLEHCQLPFEEQCLRFYETRRAVQTVSSEQVRRPIYAEGLDQWRNFEPWLGELKAALGELAAEAPVARR